MADPGDVDDRGGVPNVGGGSGKGKMAMDSGKENRAGVNGGGGVGGSTGGVGGRRSTSRYAKKQVVLSVKGEKKIGKDKPKKLNFPVKSASPVVSDAVPASNGDHGSVSEGEESMEEALDVQPLQVISSDFGSSLMHRRGVDEERRGSGGLEDEVDGSLASKEASYGDLEVGKVSDFRSSLVVSSGLHSGDNGLHGAGLRVGDGLEGVLVVASEISGGSGSGGSRVGMGCDCPIDGAFPDVSDDIEDRSCLEREEADWEAAAEYFRYLPLEERSDYLRRKGIDAVQFNVLLTSGNLIEAKQVGVGSETGSVLPESGELSSESGNKSSESGHRSSAVGMLSGVSRSSHVAVPCGFDQVFMDADSFHNENPSRCIAVLDKAGGASLGKDDNDPMKSADLVDFPNHHVAASLHANPNELHPNPMQLGFNLGPVLARSRSTSAVHDIGAVQDRTLAHNSSGVLS